MFVGTFSNQEIVSYPRKPTKPPVKGGIPSIDLEECFFCSFFIKSKKLVSTFFSTSSSIIEMVLFSLFKIFDGLKRDYGYAEISNGYKDTTTGKFKVKHGWAGKQLTDTDYIQHLNGEKSIGIQPCDDNGMVSFGAIDIDSKALFGVEKFIVLLTNS